MYSKTPVKRPTLLSDFPDLATARDWQKVGFERPQATNKHNSLRPMVVENCFFIEVCFL